MASSSNKVDPELAAALQHLPLPAHYERSSLPVLRAGIQSLFTAESFLAQSPPGLSLQEFTAEGPNGDIALSILRREQKQAPQNDKPRPCLYWIHGGGMVFGNRFQGTSRIAEWVAEFDVIAVLVEYRLAPEHPAPALVDDCYAGLCWTAENAASHGIDPRRIVIVGHSAGGGLAAGVGLMARDRSGPEIFAQILVAPMLDDRVEETVSGKQCDGMPWSGASNAMAWDCVLGGRDGSAVEAYSVPGRATDLAGLPPTYIDVGSAEMFRDTVISFASRLLEAGVATELHVWQGGFHGFDEVVPTAAVSKASRAAQTSWLDRIGVRYEV